MIVVAKKRGWLTARELSGLIGFSYRQIDYLCRTGRMNPKMVGPGGSGSRRVFSPVEVVWASVVARLTQAGFNLSAASRLATELVDNNGRASVTAGMVHVEVTLLKESEV